MKRRLLVWLFASLIPLAAAGPDNDTLTVAFERVMLTLDSYATSERLALILAHNWGDTLIYRNSVTGEFQPHLASAWRFLDDQTLELELRTDVTFHNGETFGPEAVKATLEFVMENIDTLPGTRVLAWLEGVDIIDERTVQIRAREVTPTMLETLALVAVMYPAEYLAEVGTEGMGSNPIGTGPYAFISSSDNTIVFEAFADYFGGAKGQPSIANLVIRTIPEESSRIAALRIGEIDIARSGSISPDQVATLRGNVRAEAADILRIWYFQMDTLGTSGTDVFTDVRVRQAVNHAINRQEIVDVLLDGFGTVIDTPCNPVQFGCNPDAATVYQYSPERARELLAEAGYPDGFRVDMFGYRDQQVAQAIQGYLAQVGIETDLQWFGGQYDVVSQRQAAGETASFFGAWGSSSVYDASAILNIFFADDGTYTFTESETLHEALVMALQTVDLAERQRLYDQAIGEITSQAYWVPLYAGRVVAGVSEALAWSPSSDEIERYYLASWRD